MTIPLEHDEQKAFFQMLKLSHPKVEANTFAVPNGSVLGGQNKWGLVKKLKAEGMKNGVPDIICLYPTKEHHGLVIEMKRANMTPSSISEDQHAWADKLINAGYAHCFCAGAESAMTAVKTYLEGE